MCCCCYEWTSYSPLSCFFLPIFLLFNLGSYPVSLVSLPGHCCKLVLNLPGTCLLFHHLPCRTLIQVFFTTERILSAFYFTRVFVVVVVDLISNSYWVLSKRIFEYGYLFSSKLLIWWIILWAFILIQSLAPPPPTLHCQVLWMAGREMIALHTDCPSVPVLQSPFSPLPHLSTSPSVLSNATVTSQRKPWSTWYGYIYMYVLSHSVMSDSLQPQRLLPARLLCPWGVFKQRILEWVVISSRGSSQPRDQTQVSLTADGFFTVWATREA